MAGTSRQACDHPCSWEISSFWRGKSECVIGFTNISVKRFQRTWKMFYIVGLGLADEKDVSVKGLEIIRRAERVYLEAYTAVLLVDQAQLVRTTSPSVLLHIMLTLTTVNRKPTMAVPSSSPTAKWSNRNPTRSLPTPTRKT